jgi:phage terminase small subunit
LHLVEGTIIPCRHADRALEPQPGPLTVVPRGLSKDAKKWWQDRVTRLAEIGVATEADVESLVAMAECWAALQAAIKAVRISPLDKESRIAFLAYNEAFSKWASKFGLTPSDRAKVTIIPLQEAEEKTAEKVYFG